MTPRHRAMLVAVISTIAVVTVLGVWPVAVGRFGPAGLFVPAIAALGVVLATLGYPAGISAAAVLLGAQYGVSLHGVPGVDAAAVFEAVGLALLVGCGGWIAEARSWCTESVAERRRRCAALATVGICSWAVAAATYVMVTWRGPTGLTALALAAAAIVVLLAIALTLAPTRYDSTTP